MQNSTSVLKPAASELVRRIPSEEIPWIPYPLIANSFIRVLHVDEATNTVILNYRMAPHTITPVHGHHCVATALTVDGEWFYDDLCFRKGDIAFESTVEVHQPITKELGATLLTTLIGGAGNDKLLENYNEDGTRTILRTKLFKAMERLSPKDFDKLDFTELVS
jgi:hypothetical protein